MTSTRSRAPNTKEQTACEGPAASASFVAEAIDRVKTKTMHSAEFRKKTHSQFSTPDGVPIHPLKGPPSEESICFISCEKRRVTIRARLDLSPRLQVKPTDTDRGYHLDRSGRPYYEYGLQSTTPLQVRYSSPLTEAGSREDTAADNSTLITYSRPSFIIIFIIIHHLSSLSIHHHCHHPLMRACPFPFRGLRPPLRVDPSSRWAPFAFPRILPWNANGGRHGMSTIIRSVRPL